MFPIKTLLRIALGVMALASVPLFSGCATEITPEQIAQGDYGPAPTNVEESIKAIMAQSLKDPYSAVYRFGTPEKGYITKAPIAGGGVEQFGWMLTVGINAKNSYGAYIGEQSYRFFYKDGQWKDVSYIVNL